LNDGAAAVVVASRAKAEALDRAPLARIVGYTHAAVEPKRVFIAPIYAIPKLLDKIGWTLKDVDLIELNEAFAAQVLACDRELHLDRSKLNVHGGAISLGHPIGCTGARIVTTLLHALQSRGGRYGLATLCISGGMGLSMIVEKC